MVDIGRGGREEIAEILEMLKFCEPKVIGLDVNFDAPTEDDSSLLEAISSSPSLVLPLCVESKGDDRR